MSALVLMGSGETAPVMVKHHRRLMAQAGVPDLGPGVFLDTTFAFQANSTDLITKTAEYFARSVGVPVELASWPRRERPVTEAESSLALLSQARWVFAGPGSPSYALRHWRDTAVPMTLTDVARRGGTLVFGSAAACTVGSHTLPVYEIYKVGTDPFLLPGMDLLAQLTGLSAVVIPHYDNAEGGSYDTRFCYIGEDRLELLEQQVPAGVGILGVDEHTAVVLDLEQQVAEVIGNGTMTLRHQGHSVVAPSGERLDFADLAACLRGERSTLPGADGARTTDQDGDHSARSATRQGRPTDEGSPDVDDVPTSLNEATERSRAAFDAAMAARDVPGCVGAILALESAIVDWSRDTLQSDQNDRARRELRSLIVRLGDLAERGAGDPADVVRPFVETLLELRDRARSDKDFATSDLIRDRLTAAGLQVKDTPEGTTWLVDDDGNRA